MSVQSNFSNRFPDETRATEIILPGYDPSGRLFVETAPGVYQDVYVQRRVVSVPMATYGKQVFDINLGQRVGLSLSVPIFQNRQLRTNYDRARLNAEGIRLQLDQDNLNLQADIYNAHTNAVNAHQRFLAARKAVEASQKALDFSQKRYDAGLLTTFELITNQNNLFRARLDATAAQYEYVFRMKLLEFYKGQGLKL